MTVRLSSFVVIISFFLYSVLQQLFSPLYLLAHFLCFSYSAIGSFLCIFHFIYCIVQFYLFFTSSRSLLNISCIFSISPCIHSIYLCLHFISKVLDHLCYCYSEFFSGRFPISSSFVWSYGFLPCYFICCMLLCLLILFDLLYLGYPFCKIQGRSSSYCVESALSGWGWVSILCRFPD